jgi:hypothetical protein
VPKCMPIICPSLEIDDPHLTLVEHNTSYGGRAVFRCAWGYRLTAPPGVECEVDGQWSGPVPSCEGEVHAVILFTSHISDKCSCVYVTYQPQVTVSCRQFDVL